MSVFYLTAITIKDKSAAIFCPQVAAWVSDMFCNFYSVKTHKIAINSATSKTKEKKNLRFGVRTILENIDVWLTKF